VAIAYFVGEQRAAAVAVFATTALTASILAVKRRRVPASFYAILIAVIVALWNPGLLAFFGPENSRWSTGGAWAGLLLLLLAAPLLTLRPPKKAAGIRPPEAVPQRSMTYALLLTTVSRIPTYVKRWRPHPAPRRQEKITPPASAPAAYVLRGLPTPPEPVRRWPPPQSHKSR